MVHADGTCRSVRQPPYLFSRTIVQYRKLRGPRARYLYHRDKSRLVIELIIDADVQRGRDFSCTSKPDILGTPVSEPNNAAVLLSLLVSYDSTRLNIDK